jgi:hypothetical protein
MWYDEAERTEEVVYEMKVPRTLRATIRKKFLRTKGRMEGAGGGAGGSAIEDR